MKIISIEGNIGSGKSTFLAYLKEHIRDPGVCFLDEPVAEWETIKDESGVSILENYYKDTKSFAFSFQMMAYISRLAALKQALKHPRYTTIVTERSLDTDRYVFCKMLYDTKLINKIEYTIYNKWFDTFALKEDITYVYLKTDPGVAYERVIQRDRTGETIPLQYLSQCHTYHEEWLRKKKCVVLDGNYSNTPNLLSQRLKHVCRLL